MISDFIKSSLWLFNLKTKLKEKSHVTILNRNDWSDLLLGMSDQTSSSATSERPSSEGYTAVDPPPSPPVPLLGTQIPKNKVVSLPDNFKNYRHRIGSSRFVKNPCCCCTKWSRGKITLRHGCYILAWSTIVTSLITAALHGVRLHKRPRRVSQSFFQDLLTIEDYVNRNKILFSLWSIQLLVFNLIPGVVLLLAAYWSQKKLCILYLILTVAGFMSFVVISIYTTIRLFQADIGFHNNEKSIMKVIMFKCALWLIVMLVRLYGGICAYAFYGQLTAAVYQTRAKLEELLDTEAIYLL